MHEVLVNRLGGLSLPRKSVFRLTDRPDMTLDVYCGRKTTMQQCKVLWRPTLGNSKARAYFACSRCGGDCLDFFLAYRISTAFSLCLREGSILPEILSQ